MFRPSKKIRLFAVIDRETNYKKFLTLVCEKEDAAEFITTILRIKHKEHYIMWCNLHNFNANSMDTWFEYFKICIPEEEKTQYKIIRIAYRWKDIVAMLRMLINANPYNCSFSLPMEFAYKHTIDETIKQVDDLLASDLTGEEQPQATIKVHFNEDDINKDE